MTFDTVDHKILIDKLKFYGVDGTVILWIESYLTGRKQATKFLGIKSIYLCIKFGVPQGSLLGPLLFSIYINDIVNACNLSKPYLFADDGALLFVAQHVNYIFRKSLRGEGKHFPILNNLASSYSTYCDLSVQGCAQKTLKKGAPYHSIIISLWILLFIVINQIICSDLFSDLYSNL